MELPQASPPEEHPFLSALTTSMAAVYLGSVLVCSYSTTLPLSWLPQLLGLVLFVLFLGDYARRSLRTVRIPLPIKWYISWVVVALLSTVIGPMTPDAKMTAMTLVKVAAITCIFSITIRTPRQLAQMSSLVICGFLASVLLNLDEIAAIRDAAAAGILTESDRLEGTMGNANVLGIYAVTVSWLGVVLLLTLRAVSARFLGLFAIPFGVTVALWTQSRKAILAIPLSVATALILSAATRPNDRSLLRWIREHMAIGVAGVVLGVMATFLVWYSPYGTRVRDLLSGKTDDSAVKRADMGVAGIQLWMRSPVLGAGLEQFRAHDGGSYSHSTPVEILVSTGLIGFALYFGSLLLLGKQSLLLAHRARGTHLASLAVIVAMLAGIFTFFNLFAVMYGDRLLWPLLGAFSGVVYGQSQGAIRDHVFLSDMSSGEYDALNIGTE